MNSSLRWMVAVGCVALLALPAVAQNTGGLPGLGHELALRRSGKRNVSLYTVTLSIISSMWSWVRANSIRFGSTGS